jgi:hypothetical protein
MGLIAQYRLHGDAIESIGGFDGTITGSPTTAVGKLGQCLEFDGSTGQYISTSLNLHGLSEFSISCWARGDSWKHTTHTIVASNYDYNAATASGFYLGSTWANANDMSFFVYDKGASGLSGGIQSSGDAVSTGEWYHYVGVFKGGEFLKFYIDTELIGTDLSVPDYMHDDLDLDIAKRADSTAYNWNGAINDIRLYDHILSLKEIKLLSQAKVLHYGFNDFQEPTTNLTYESSAGTGDTLGSDVSANSVKTYLGNGKYRYANDGTGVSTIRIYCNSSDLISGDTYACQCAFEGYTGSSLHFDWCDVTLQTGVNQSNGILSGADRRATYDSTYRFMDIGLQSGDTIILFNPQVEHKTYITPFHGDSAARVGIIRDSSGQGNDSDPIGDSDSPQWSTDTKTGSGNYIFEGDSHSYITIEDTNLHVLEELTAMAWVKPSATIGDANIFTKRPSNQGWIIHNSATNDLKIHVYTDAWYSAQSTSEVYVVGEWVHIAMTWDGTTLIGYANGDTVCSTTPSTGGNIIDTAGDLGIGNSLPYSTIQPWPGNINNVRLYATALGRDDIKEIVNTRASITDTGSFLTNEFIENKPQDKALLDYYNEWVVGDSGTQGSFGKYGDTEDNVISNDIDPWGNTAKVWNGISDGGSGTEGGFAKTWTCDSTKRYRYSIFVKRIDVVGDTGRTYLGARGGGGGETLNLNGSTNSNPYFWNGNDPPTYYEWYLLVGLLHPYSGDTRASWGVSGMYNLTGNQTTGGTEFKIAENKTTQTFRTFLYAADVGVTNIWCYPRIDVIDGSEPTIQDLCDGLDSRFYDFYAETDSSDDIRGISVRGSTYIGTMSEVGPTSGLIAWWKLDGSAIDSTGVHHGTLTTGTGIYEDGVRGRSFHFDGSASNVAIAHASTLKPDSGITICAWIKPDTLATTNREIYRKEDGTDRHLFSFQSTGTILSFGLGIGGVYGELDVTVTPGDFTDGDWHFIAAIYDGSNKKIYKDNVEIGDSIISGAIGTTGSASAYIGCYNAASEWFDGGICHVRIYNRGLPPEELSLLYSSFGYGIDQKVRQSRNGIVYTSGEFSEIL